MANEIEEDGLIRRYLLGQLAEDARQPLEERIMTDTELYNRVLLAEDEMVEEYVRGGLSESEREGFEASFLSTIEGRKQVSFEKALSSYVASAASSEGQETKQPAGEETAGITRERGQVGKVIRPAWWRRPTVAPYFRMAAAAVIVLGVGLGIWRVFFYQSEVAKGMAALAKAYSIERPLEARISGLNYAALANTRGGERTKVDDVSLNRAERILLDEVSERPSSAAHHALGRLYLAERRFDDAIRQLDQALTGDPSNAQLHNDYGAALLEKGKAADAREASAIGLVEFARSLDHLSKALELDDSKLEALFNRALCHEYMLLYREAEKDWKDYIAKDPNSKWAGEANQRLKGLEDRPRQTLQNKEHLFQDFLNSHQRKDDAGSWNSLNQYRDIAGNFIQNRLIDDYLDLVTEGRNVEADKTLDALSYAADLEYRQTRDLFMLDLVQYFRTATPSQRTKSLKARSMVKAGHESFNKNNIDEAKGLYAEAKRAFQGCGAVCEAMYVDYLIGQCYLLQSNSMRGLEIFQELAQSCEKFQYKRLLAQSLGAIAYANQDFRDFSEAISNTTLALRVSEEMGDIAGRAASTFQLADEYRFINNYQKALDLHAQAFCLTLTCLTDRSQLWRNYFSISLSFYGLGQYGAAIGFQKEALQIALEGDRSLLAGRSYNHLAQMLARQGYYDEAINNIERALEIGNALAERGIRIETTAYCFLHLGYVYRKSGDFKKAIDSYNHAIEIYNELNSTFFNYMAWKDKLLCCLEQGDCPSIERDLKTLLDLFEQHRSKILEESNRNSFFDAEQSIYDVAIEFEYLKKGDPGKAFDLSERSRARSLHDLMSTNVTLVDDQQRPDILFEKVSEPMGLEEIKARMPKQSQILQYAVLKDNLLIWIVSQDGFFSTSRRLASEDLNKSILTYLHAIRDPSQEGIQAALKEAAYLYELLIGAIESEIDSSKQLCIVPDKILNYLPFAALMVSEGSGSYLIEKYTFVLSPSSNVFIRCSEAGAEKDDGRDERLLSVGNPLFDHNVFSDLADLPSAAKEAKAIARYYSSSDTIIGNSATERRIKSEMEKADVIHLATHAIADEWNPMRSKLALAKDAAGVPASGSDGVLQAYEIYNLNLARARLAVLSACRTGVEKYYGGEGMIGLSRPFLAKRLPVVVASLWPVDSDSTARLMISFHRNRKVERRSTAEALQQAQLEMLRNPDKVNQSPYHWASFVVIGGHAGF